MSASAMRRGACPTLPEPMATGDGLLARHRTGGADEPERNSPGWQSSANAVAMA